MLSNLLAQIEDYRDWCMFLYYTWLWLSGLIATGATGELGESSQNYDNIRLAMQGIQFAATALSESIINLAICFILCLYSCQAMGGIFGW